jgi:ribosomal-protein-alanine N-acetyltransferase
MTVVSTTRLLLRPAETSDLEAFHAIMADPVAMAYWSTSPHQSLEQTREWLQSMIDINPSEGEDFVAAHEGCAIGKVGFYRFPEIGFIFSPNAWGRGFATEALTAVLHCAFEVHDLPAVEADVDPRNQASLRLLARFGFEEVNRKARTWLVGERWCDSVYLRLPRTEWGRTQGASFASTS